ncbi:MAG: ATP-binding cassette domain-containing protein [Pseudomonadota bacterium]
MRLHVSDLSKAYHAHTVLSVNEAEFGTHGIEGLIGPNGAGKSTLVGLLTRRIAPSSGSVDFELDDQRHDLMPMRSYEVARLGLVKTNQRIQGFDGLTIRDSLRMTAASEADETPWAAWIAPLARDEAVESEIEALLSRFPFSDPDGYARSGGEKKLLDILRCLMLKPRMLLMDEPAAGLPDEITQEVMSLIRQKVDADEMVVVIIEHDLELIWKHCGYVHFLSEGELLFQGSPEEVKANRVVAEKYMGV